MANEALKQELDAAYDAYVQALEGGDFEAFKAVTKGVMPADVAEAQIREAFPQYAQFLLGLAPKHSEMEFFTVETHGDDLAGYYCLVPPEKRKDTDFKDPNFVLVNLTAFRKVQGAWRVSGKPMSAGSGAPKGGTVEVKARRIIETHLNLAALSNYL